MLGIHRKMKKWTAQLLDLPQDLVFDLPRVTMIGNMQIYIENHRGVIHFSPQLLELRLSTGSMEIRGTELVIRGILSEEVFIEGHIHDIRYVQE
ncbi:sporulation protein YqfC [Marinicrinis sediminis]|uniref:Sporulation protein YqfC n=1 Tax=Marinicrinis sediminis TaxID=1652465 RepID=A0ABW5RC36_9BACL